MNRLAVVVMLVACLSVRAQTRRWSQVQALAPGTTLMVTTWHSAPCMLEESAPDGIGCRFRGMLFWVDRAQIRRISLVTTGNAVVVATLIGMAAGATTEAAAGDALKDSRVNAIAGAVLGGGVGYVVGHLFSRYHSVIVYSR